MTLLEKTFSALVLIIVYTCIVFLSYINAYLWRNVDLVIVKDVIEFSVDIYILRSLETQKVVQKCLNVSF